MFCKSDSFLRQSITLGSVKHSKAFKINEVYQAEVDRLLNSRNKSRTIHKSGNIAASGDELEEPFRAVLRRRLPSKFFIGHGHIVDQELNVSPQFDVIIADNNATPILFEGENGLQYFPWESVYAIGEVKSTYVESKRPIETFAKNIRTLKQRLKRENTPSNYLGNDLFLGKGLTLDDDSTTNAPTGRAYHTAVWIGSEMIVWGGVFFDGSYHYLNTGGRYCAAAPSSTPTPTPTSTPTATATGTPAGTPRPLPTGRPRPTPAPRPTP
jgi:hypothetical protein